MPNLNVFDYTAIGIYFLILIAFGFILSRRAAKSLEDYFLGGRKLPWWALGMSGTASWFDITGTALIVSFLYMLGPRGIYIEFRGGACLVLGCMLVFTGKWHRRSGCITAAEWLPFRFGEGPGAQFARVLGALATVAGGIGCESTVDQDRCGIDVVHRPPAPPVTAILADLLHPAVLPRAVAAGAAEIGYEDAVDDGR